MKYYLEEKEVTIEELKEALNNLVMCDADGGYYQEIVLDGITDDGDMCFSIEGQSTFG